jgi:exodeoxyribonuclease VII large subunit
MANGNGIIDALFDDEENRPISVSELAAMIRGELERKFSSVWVEGEIVGFTVSGPGHWYFSLRDADAQIKAACFVNQNSRLRLRPFNGLQAIVRGKFSFYPQRGDAQLIVTSVEAAGEGAFKVEFERRKKLLESEGLFSPSLKRPIPKIPRRVGIVTSPTGAAFHDIVKVITRRTRSLDIVLLPAKVQGEGASEEIIRSIEIANSFNLTAQDVEKIDVLIVGRGGGSQEDLWAFNDEGLARAIRASSIPVISAVGHEIDTTISDMVADFRAATPSVAAAMVSAGEEDLARKIEESYRRIVGAMSYSLLGVRHRLEFLSASQSLSVEPLALRNGREKLGDLDDDLSRIIGEKLSDLSDRLDSAMRRMSPEKLAADLADKRGRFGVINHRMMNVIESAVAMKGQRLRTLSASLNALSPLRVLSRGYSLTKKADSLVVSVKQVKVGDLLDITVSDGRIKVKAERIEEGMEDAR